jgi:hypothetical protein
MGFCGMYSHACRAAVAGRELLYRLSFLLVMLLSGVTCKFTVSHRKMLIIYPGWVKMFSCS